MNKIKDERNKRVIWNIISNITYQAVVIVMGLLIPKLYLESFGSEVNGLVSTVKQVFSYLILLEAGVGLAAQQALYKPVALSDKASINAILSATRQHYNKTGIIYALITGVFAVVYSLCVKTDIPQVTVFLIIIFYGIPSTISFFVQGKYRILLEVEGKGYVLTNFATVMHLVNSILKVILLLYTKNLILIQAMYCIEPILQMLLVVHYIHKHFPWLNTEAEPDHKAISQKNSVLVHQISGVIFNNTDAILISVFCGFKAVSVYAIYSMFFQYIDTMITSVSSGLTFRMGQLFQTDRNKFKQYFEVYEAVYIMSIFIIFTMAAAFLLPVIKLYTSGIEDINYIDPVLLILFVIMKLLANSKIPCNEVMNFAGVFKDTKIHAVIEVIINLAVSIVAIQFWGIRGGIIGTVAALMFRGNIMIYYANKKILGRSSLITYRRFFVNILLFASVIGFVGLNSGDAPNFMGVVCLAALNAIWIAALFIIVNSITERKNIKLLLQFVRRVRT